MTNPEKTSEENDIEEEVNASNGVEENIKVNTESCQQTNTDENEENRDIKIGVEWCTNVASANTIILMKEITTNT